MCFENKVGTEQANIAKSKTCDLLRAHPLAVVTPYNVDGPAAARARSRAACG